MSHHRSKSGSRSRRKSSKVIIVFCWSQCRCAQRYAHHLYCHAYATSALNTALQLLPLLLLMLSGWWSWSCLARLLTKSYHLPHTALELLSIVSPHNGGVNIGRRVVVGVTQHADNTHNDGLDAMYGPPSHISSLLGVELVFARGVEDADTDFAVLVDVRVPHGTGEAHYRWHVGEILRELQLCLKETSFVQRLRGPYDHHLPFEQVIVIAQTNANTVWWIS